MSDRRKSDIATGRQWFRTPSRIFVDGGLWYFDTREGTTEGPYIDEVQAKLALDTYVKLMSSRFVPSMELSLVEKEADEVPGAASLQRVGASGRKW